MNAPFFWHARKGYDSLTDEPVAEGSSEYDKESSPRQQSKTVRVLRLIDLLAAQRYPKSVAELHRAIVMQ